ncbi:MAG TPA: sulfotransferase [Steroidobacteraceae bacterium]|nr:sulfotransferase [Steroidobacteraceae bacterium]
MSEDPAPFREALALHEQGRWSEAESRYRAAATAGHGRSAVNLAVLCLQQRRPEEALEFAERAVELDTTSAEARATLGTALAGFGRADEAIRAYETALMLDAPPVEAHYGLGCVLESRGRLHEALACYRRALTLDPEYAEAECRLAAVLAQLGRAAEAIAPSRRALDIDPNYEEARRGLVRSLRSAGRVAEAEVECRRLLEHAADRGTALAELAATLTLQGRHGAAIELLRQAVAERPQDPETHRRLALALAEHGDLDGAVQSLEAAIALRAEPAYLRELTNLRRSTAGDPHLERLDALEARIDSLDVNARIQLHFALGRALTDSGAPAAGFRHLLRGNVLHRSRICYDEVGTLRLFDRVRATFTPQAVRRLSGLAPATGKAPIFIVGMPRCGSTLIEQVLASHPRVHGAGESPAFGEAVTTLGAGLEYPELATELDATDLERLATGYLAAISRDAAQRMRTADKMLANTLFLGLVHGALPDARLVWVRRDPVDTCLSCFTELFTPDQPFAYELGELGRFYRAHEELMCHWQKVLPPGVLLQVSYEELLADFDTVVRGLLAHCQLGWDERVRQFHRTARRVTSASLAQVRRPLYRRTRWRPDDATLAPLLEALAG